MARFVTLASWTEHGINDYRETVRRSQAADGMAAKVGGKIVDLNWTVGPYDLVFVSEFPDDESYTAFALALSALGNVRTTSMRAYTAEEMQAIIDKT
jgi:uncharacterized protein with GYD domain